MLYDKKPDDPQVRFYISKCKYCGHIYIKLENRTAFCSDDCRRKSTQDSKARYQRKRRKLIRDGELVSNECEYVGTGFLSKHRCEDFKAEHESILKEKRRIGVRI